MENNIDDMFDDAIDDATHAVIAAFENGAGVALPDGGELSDLMVRINDSITALLAPYKIQES